MDTLEKHNKEMEEKFEKTFYTKIGDDYFLDNGYYSSPDFKLGDRIKSFITSKNTELLKKIAKGEIESKRKDTDSGTMQELPDQLIYNEALDEILSLKSLE